jgi:radical SAM protein with 4Fe4S-binding SPASM domain
MKDTDRFIPDFIAYWKSKSADHVNVTECMTWLGSIDDRRAKMPANYGYKPCIEPFKSCCILSDGTIVPCCMDVNGEMPLGNIANSSFEKIWLGNQYNRLRIQMLDRTIKKGSICDGCYMTFCQSKAQRVIMMFGKLLSASRSRKYIRHLLEDNIHRGSW